MAKKKTTEKALNIDNILFNCRDYLRAARNSGSFFEKRDMMLDVQKDIVGIYEAYKIRKEINEKLKAQIKDICPILIKGSIEEARKAKEA